MTDETRKEFIRTMADIEESVIYAIYRLKGIISSEMYERWLEMERSL